MGMNTLSTAAVFLSGFASADASIHSETQGGLWAKANMFDIECKLYKKCMST